MESTSLTTVPPSVSSSSSYQPTKKKQNEKVRKQKGRSLTVPGILVNQDLGKIKLEDDIPAPVKMETDSDSNQATSEAHAVETFTEEFVVTKEDVSFESPEEPGQGHEDQSSSCTCQEEISSLKDALKELTVQVHKQNQVITGIRSGLRNAVLSLMTCYQDEKEDGALRDMGHDTQEESPVIVDTPSKDGEPMSIAMDPLLIENADISSANQEATQPEKHVSCSGESIAEAEIRGASASKSSSSNEAGLFPRQNTEDAVMDDDDVDADVDVHDDDSSYVPDDSELESDNEMEDVQDRQRNKTFSKSNERSVSTTDSTANSERLFGCSKCGKNYKSRWSLREHMLFKHSTNRSQYKCHLCSKLFNSKTGVRNHISTINNGIRYNCAHCPGKFTRKREVLLHERRVHTDGGPPSQQCKICGIHLAKSEKALRTHMSKVHKTLKTSRPCKRLKKILLEEIVRGSSGCLFRIAVAPF